MRKSKKKLEAKKNREKFFDFSSFKEQTNAKRNKNESVNQYS